MQPLNDIYEGPYSVTSVAARARLCIAVRALGQAVERAAGECLRALLERRPGG